MMFGLNSKDIQTIKQILAANSHVETAIVFGSRASGQHSKGSDVDIVIVGSDVDSSDIYLLSDQLNEETMMPYQFDIIDYQSIKDSGLLGVINSHGQAIYRRLEQRCQS